MYDILMGRAYNVFDTFLRPCSSFLVRCFLLPDFSFFLGLPSTGVSPCRLNSVWTSTQLDYCTEKHLVGTAPCQTECCIRDYQE